MENSGFKAIIIYITVLAGARYYKVESSCIQIFFAHNYKAYINIFMGGITSLLGGIYVIFINTSANRWKKYSNNSVMQSLT